MSNSPKRGHSATDVTTRELLAALTGLEFGSLVVTVHHGRIVQIERREKVRLGKSGGAVPPGPSNLNAD